MNDNITEINKDTFWALIQEAKDTCGQDTDASAKYMIDRLAGLGPDQSLIFLNYMDAYKTFPFDTVCGMPPRSSEWTDAAMTASATFAPGSSFREKMFIWRLWQIRTPLPM